MSYDNHIIVGKILTTHGIKGWLTIGSYTSNQEDIFKYNLKVSNKQRAQADNGNRT